MWAQGRASKRCVRYICSTIRRAVTALNRQATCPAEQAFHDLDSHVQHVHRQLSSHACAFLCRHRSTHPKVVIAARSTADPLIAKMQNRKFFTVAYATKYWRDRIVELLWIIEAFKCGYWIKYEYYEGYIRLVFETLDYSHTPTYKTNAQLVFCRWKWREYKIFFHYLSSTPLHCQVVVLNTLTYYSKFYFWNVLAVFS